MAMRQAGSRPVSRLALTLIVTAVAACAAPGDLPSPAAAASEPIDIANPLGSYLAGRHAQHERQYGAAAEYFGRALAQDPNDVDLINKTFLFDTSEGRIAEALRLAARITQLDPAAPLPNLVLAVDRLKVGDYAGAASRVDALPNDGIHRFITPLIAAWTKIGLGQPEAAATALAPLKEVQGFAPLVDFHAGLIADYGGHVAEAEAAYQRVLQSSTRSNWRTVETLGSLYERSGRTDQARALYQRFIGENADSDMVVVALARLSAGEKPPPRIASAADGAAEALFDIASILNQSETVDLSLIYGRLAVELKPNFPLAALLVSDILEAQHRPAEALAIDRSIDARSPYGWSARLRAAANLQALDKTDQAIAELKAMAAERPDRMQPLVQLGDILRGQSRFAESADAYDQAVARMGKQDARHWVIFYSRGIALERAGQWPRAEPDLLHALELQPEQPLVLNYLGYSWVEKNQHLAEAMKMIERAVQLRPNDGYIVDSLGWAFYRLGNFAQASRYLEHAAELRPEDPTINDHLGDAYWQTGRIVEARNQWRRALQFGPEADDAKSIGSKLDKGIDKPPARAGTATQGG
ncbi:MAG TPA: tetratricopeptide repeat protein [Stellaceae bacterium]|nr:tetratricopeptide repeat protein [Stellaceae bacterium]